MLDLNLNPSQKQLRQFGLIALVAFVISGTWLLGTGTLFGWSFDGMGVAAGYGLISLGVLAGAFAALWPSANRPLFVLLTVLTYPIGFVVSHAVMLLLFFGIITPVGLLFRVIGRDPLHRDWDERRDSYWEDLGEEPAKKDYFRQF